MLHNRCAVANLRTIGKSGQRKLSSSCVGVAGLGGVGGIAFELLVRAGVGKMKIADSGFFEESNANRQSLWTKETDGKKKTDAAVEFAMGVNKGCKIEKYGEISGKNAASFSDGCAAVIDATDRKDSRLAVWQGCKKAGVPYIFASALGEKGMLTIFSEKKDFEKEFGLKGKKYRDFLSCAQGATGSPASSSNNTRLHVASCDHSLGPVANTIGCLAAQQALNIMLRKPSILFPKVLSLNAFSDAPFALHCF